MVTTDSWIIWIKFKVEFSPDPSGRYDRSSKSSTDRHFATGSPTITTDVAMITGSTALEADLRADPCIAVLAPGRMKWVWLKEAAWDGSKRINEGEI